MTTYTEIAANLSKLVGGTWTVETTNFYVYLIGKGVIKNGVELPTMKIEIRTHDDKLTFEAELPNHMALNVSKSAMQQARGTYISPDLRISVSSLKSPKQIAADIQRRLFPIYSELLPIAHTIVLNQNLREAAAEVVRVELAQSPKIRRSSSNPNHLSILQKTGEGYGEIEVSTSCRVNFKLNDVSAATAKKIIALLEGA